MKWFICLYIKNTITLVRLFFEEQHRRRGLARLRLYDRSRRRRDGHARDLLLHTPLRLLE